MKLLNPFTQFISDEGVERIQWVHINPNGVGCRSRNWKAFELADGWGNQESRQTSIEMNWICDKRRYESKDGEIQSKSCDKRRYDHMISSIIRKSLWSEGHALNSLFLRNHHDEIDTFPSSLNSHCAWVDSQTHVTSMLPKHPKDLEAVSVLTQNQTIVAFRARWSGRCESCWHLRDHWWAWLCRKRSHSWTIPFSECHWFQAFNQQKHLVL